MSKIFLHIRAAAYHTQIPLPLFPFRIDWIWQAGFGLLVGTTSGIVAAYSSGQTSLASSGWTGLIGSTSTIASFAGTSEP